MVGRIAFLTDRKLHYFSIFSGSTLKIKIKFQQKNFLEPKFKIC